MLRPLTTAVRWFHCRVMEDPSFVACTMRVELPPLTPEATYPRTEHEGRGTPQCCQSCCPSLTSASPYATPAILILTSLRVHGCQATPTSLRWRSPEHQGDRDDAFLKL